MSRLGKTEKLILSIALLLLLVFSYFLYDDSLLFPKAKNDRLELIGDFVVSQNDVRRKNIDTFSWLPVSHKDNIYQNDSVFTGDRSEAVLHLQDGTEIHLEANSLIALTSKNGQLNLDLRYGNLVGEIAKNSALVVKSGGEEIKLESTETSTTEKSKVHVNKTRSGNVDLKLLTGQVQLSDKTKTKTALVKDSVVAVSTKGEVKKIEPVQVHLKTADLNQSRVSADDPISLEWEGQGPISHFELEIAQTPDFNSVTLSKVTPENQIKITDPLEPGNYFVRIKAYDRNGEVGAQSTPQKLSLQLLTAPVITAPQKSTEISQELKVKSPEDLVTTTEIKWEAPAPFKNFTYQISQDPTFAQILKEEKTVASSAISPRLASGTYWLRVSGQVTPQSHPAWSEPVSFKINLVAKKELILERPILLTQKINFKAPSPKNRNPAAVPAPEMSWKPVTYSKKYQLQVAKDLDFTKPEVYEVKNTKILWNQFKGGHSYYRVFALGDNGKKSPSSDVGEVFVELNSPLLQPLKPMVSVSAKNSAQETRASWTAIPDAHSYLVQMDTNDQFATPQSYEFKTNEGRWNVNAPGEYKVRVRALDEGNNPLTDFSNVEILKFTYHPRLVTPLLLEPYDKISIFLQQASEPSIWVEWRKVDGAELYKVEVSDRADFSHILISSAVSGNRFLLKDKVPLGTIYWRVRAQSRDESEISAWTEKRQFTIYHQKNETF